ncbi:MAG: vWA domain-containing protein [Desulfococcaceae bacterium]
MKTSIISRFLIVAVLAAATCGALAHTRGGFPGKPGPDPISGTDPSPTVGASIGPVSLSARLAQDKIYTGGDGSVSMALTLAAEAVESDKHAPAQSVDLVIVLDRSGSMAGPKMDNALAAIRGLLDRLGPSDRFALVSYASRVRRDTALLPVTPANRKRLRATLDRIRPGGGTNLGGGLRMGIDSLRSAETATNGLSRVVLVSDGLANEGIVDPEALGRMAANATESRLSVSTVGVGADFNERLMTALADRGTGAYYFLDRPEAFAAVFESAFREARQAVASGLEIRVPMRDGLRLTHAAGYPIEYRDGSAIFRPGDLLAGQERHLFLTFQVPTGSEREFNIKDVEARFLQANEPVALRLPDAFTIACVADPNAAVASIDRSVWEKKVLQDDFNQLRDAISNALRLGDSRKAQQEIQEYRRKTAAMNDVVGSDAVEENLTEALGKLEAEVKETVTAAPSSVQRAAKKMQFEAYQGRRDRKAPKTP